MPIPSITKTKIDNLLFGVPRLTLSCDNSSTNIKDSNSPGFGVGSSLKFSMNVSPRIKLQSIVREGLNESDNPYPSFSESSPFLRYHPISKETEGKSHLKLAYTARGKGDKGIKQDDLRYAGSISNFSNQTSNEYPCLRFNPYVVLGLFGLIILCSCCCTLVIRRKIVSCLKCFKPKKKKKKPAGKYDQIDVESGQGMPRRKANSFSLKLGKKKRPESSKALINTATQDSNASILKVKEEISTPIGCCQCCKKKGRKGKKRKKLRE